MRLPLSPTALAVALAVALAAVAACRPDQPPSTDNPARWSISSVSGLLQPGSVDTVHFAAVLDSGWYIYSLTQEAGGPTPMSVTIAPSPPFSLVGNIAGPQPVVIFDKEFGISTERYTGTPAFSAVVAVTPGGQPRSPSLDLKVRYQSCNETFCLPARTARLTTPVRIASP